MNLARLSPCWKVDAITRVTSSLSSASVTFLRCGPFAIFSQRLAADEVVVELHERAVADVPRRQVVVLDVARRRSCRRSRPCLVAVGRQPLAVGLHRLVAGVDRRQRRRDPARFQRVRRIGAAADQAQAEVLAGLDQIASRTASPSSHGPNNSKPGWPAMPWRSARTVLPAMVSVRHVEELQLRRRLADRLLDHLHRVRALDLEAIGLAPARRCAARCARRARPSRRSSPVCGVELRPSSSAGARPTRLNLFSAR